MSGVSAHLERVAQAIADSLTSQAEVADMPDRYVDWIDLDELAAAAVEALGLTVQWAAADAKFEELGGGVIEATIGRTPERADRWMSVDEPGWVKVSRLVSPWVVQQERETDE